MGITFPTAAHFLGHFVLAEHGFKYPALDAEASLGEAEMDPWAGLGWAGPLFLA